MSPLAEREHGRDAATAFINEHEERGVTIQAQQEQIAGLTATLNDQANRIDLLNKALKEAKGDAARYMRYSVELSTQIRTNVAANARALSIADEVMTDSALASRATEIESLLQRSDKPLDMPAETADTTDGTRAMMQSAGLLPSAGLMPGPAGPLADLPQ